jgi:hypothetical protein
MRLLFVNWAFENHGSAQDIYNYAVAAREAGHEVALYGVAKGCSGLPYSTDVNSADGVVFIFEYTTFLERLDFARLVAKIPRRKRVVIDCDGKYNDWIRAAGDYNHLDAAAARRWVEVCDSLSDKICQPTLRPLRPNVRPFLFHGYSPPWEAANGGSAKRYGIRYVGNNWFRWRPMEQLLRGIEPIRAEVGRIGLVGNGWTNIPSRRDPDVDGEAYYNDPAFLRRLDVEVLPPVRFEKVVGAMGEGVFSPVLYRPLFEHLGLVTCRTFETPAASAIPLFVLDAVHIQDIYGEPGLELAVSDCEPAEHILRLRRDSQQCLHVVSAIRRRLQEKHSYAERLRELIEIVES